MSPPPPQPGEFTTAPEPTPRARPLVPGPERTVKSARFRGLVWFTFFGSLAVLGTLLIVLGWDVRQWFTKSRKPKPLVVYCAAGLKAPVEKIAREYEQEFGVPVQLQFGASQTLLANVELSGSGDVYLPADDFYIHAAREKKLLDETIPVARMTPVLAVKKGNPRHIRSLDDLLTGDAKLAQANPDAAAIGKLVRDALRAQGTWDRLEKRTLVFKGTVNDVANDVLVGTVDAGFVWDAMLAQYPDLEAVTISEVAKTRALISAGILTTSAQPTAALHFARYLTASDKGQKQFAAMGYTVVDGDTWEETPEIKLFSGAMLRPAIEETVKAFEKREGVKVTRVYNGCGILVAQMKAGESPDAYFACDLSFMNEVHDQFETPLEMSANQLVILVPKGNPFQIHKLDDLGKPGLRVGIGHEKQCALGVLTQNTLVETKQHDPVMKNVKVQTPTGDMLVNQLRTKSLDAVIAYVTNAAEAGDELEAIRIDIPCAIATQPVAVGKTSTHKQLTQRLLDALRTAESRQRFEDVGFRWKAK